MLVAAELEQPGIEVQIAAARAWLEHLGVIDIEGKFVSTESPHDMLPESGTTLETG